jgi:SPP1 family predicted phage head-tail adaptor
MITSGALRDRITFRRHGVNGDGYGNEVSGPWEDQFTVTANIAPAHGREEVLAQRLQGVRPVEITVRWLSQTRLIRSDWRLIDARNPENTYNIHDPGRDPDGKRLWLILTCTLGVAT